MPNLQHHRPAGIAVRLRVKTPSESFAVSLPAQKPCQVKRQRKPKEAKIKKKLTALQAAVREGQVPKARKPYALFTQDTLKGLPREQRKPGVAQHFVQQKWKDLAQEEKEKYQNQSRKEFILQNNAKWLHGLQRGCRYVKKPAAVDDADVAAQPDLFESEQLGSLFVLNEEEPLHKGFYSTIRKAVCSNGKFAAIKTWFDIEDPDGKAEISFYQDLFGRAHPFLEFLSASFQPPKPYLALPYIPCPNLHLFVRQAKLSNDELQAVIIQLCEALTFLWSLSYAHLDVRPCNMLWEREKHHLHLIDFGNCEKLGKTGHVMQNVLGPLSIAEYRAPELWHPQVQPQVPANSVVRVYDTV